jgi:hypothetical protein
MSRLTESDVILIEVMQRRVLSLAGPQTLLS